MPKREIKRIAFFQEYENRSEKLLEVIPEVAGIRFLSSIPNITEIWINDEASLGRNSKAIGCYCSVCRNDWRKDFGEEMPVPNKPLDEYPENSTSRYDSKMYLCWGYPCSNVYENINVECERM